MNKVKVRPLEFAVGENEYDLFIYCVGYEARASFIASKLDDRARACIAFAYASRKDHSYTSNLQFTKRAGHMLFSADDNAGEKVSRYLQDFAIRAGSLPKIAIDISSMDRTLMGGIYLACLQNTHLWNAIDILYAPAKYTDPSFTFLPVAAEVPVLPELSGRIRGPYVKTTLIVGLGYEYGVALGVIEKFEPDQLFAFRPTGTDKRFEDSIKRANFDFDFQPTTRLIDYDVTTPYQLFYDLYDITRGLIDYTEIIIAPGGPKIFSMVAIIIGLLLYPEVCVWRVSIRGAETGGNVVASGDVYGLTIEPAKD
jgi:hypothetical protein